MENQQFLSNTEIEKLKEQSENGELITFVHSENEMLNHFRRVYFPKTVNSKVLEYYDTLSITNKGIIGLVVEALSKGKEHQGANLHILLYCLSKDAEKGTKLTQAKIAQTSSKMYSTYSDYSTVGSYISKLKTHERIKSEGDFFHRLKNNLLFSDSLIKNGKGYIEIPKSGALEEYYSHPEFYKKHREVRVEKGKQEYYLVERTMREEWEEFLNYIGKPWNDFFDKHYCVINYTFGYLFLTRSNQKIVDDLIEALYVQQTEYEAKQNEYEKVLNESKDAQAVLYEIMLKNGGAKEIAPDEDPNE